MNAVFDLFNHQDAWRHDPEKGGRNSGEAKSAIRQDRRWVVDAVLSKSEQRVVDCARQDINFIQFRRRELFQPRRVRRTGRLFS